MSSVQKIKTLPNWDVKFPQFFNLEKLERESKKADLESRSPDERVSALYESTFDRLNKARTDTDYAIIIDRMKAAFSQQGANTSLIDKIRLGNVYAYALLRRGLISGKKADIESSISFYQNLVEAYDLHATELEDKIQKEHLLANLGVAYIKQYSFTSAPEDYQMALDFLKAESDRSDNTKAKASYEYLIGQLDAEKYKMTGKEEDRERAEKQLERAFAAGPIAPGLFFQCREMLAKLKGERLGFFFCCIMASGLQAQKEPEEAKNYLEIAKQLSSSLVKKPALLSLLTSQIELSKETAEKWLNFHTEQLATEDPLIKIEHLIRRSQAYILKNRFLEAAADLDEAEKIADQSPDALPNVQKKIADQRLCALLSSHAINSKPYRPIDLYEDIAAPNDLQKASELFQQALVEGIEFSEENLDNLSGKLYLAVVDSETHVEKDLQFIQSVVQEIVKRHPEKYCSTISLFHASLNGEKFKKLRKEENYKTALQLYFDGIQRIQSEGKRSMSLKAYVNLCKLGSETLPPQMILDDLQKVEPFIRYLPLQHPTNLRRLLLNATGCAYSKKYESTKDPKDLDQAISLCKEAASTTTPSEDFVIFNFDAAEALLRSPNDQNKFEGSIYFSAAVKEIAHLEQHKTCKRMHELWNSHNHPTKYAESIEKLKHAIDYALALSYLRRFLKFRNPCDLESAIELLATSTHNEGPLHFAKALEYRYILERKKDPAQALDNYLSRFNVGPLAMKLKTPNPQISLHSANYYLLQSKKRKKEAAEHAIKYYLKAVEIPVAKVGLIHACIAAFDASEHLDVRHLESAIDTYKSLDTSTLPSHHTQHLKEMHAAHLKTLEDAKKAAQILEEVKQFRNQIPPDPDSAILKLQEVDQLTSGSPFIKGKLLLELGQSLVLRKKQYHNTSDISLGIRRLREALTQASAPSALRAKVLVQLGRVLLARADEEKKDPTEGVNHLEEARKILGEFKNDQLFAEASYTISWQRYVKSHQISDLDEVFTHLRSGLSYIEPLLIRLRILVESLKSFEFEAYTSSDLPLIDKLIDIYSEYYQKPTSDTRATFPLRIKLAELLAFRGRNRRNEKDLLEAIGHYESHSTLLKFFNSSKCSEVYQDLGKTYEILSLVTQNLNHLDKALAHYETALTTGGITDEDKAEILEREARILLIRKDHKNPDESILLAVKKLNHAFMLNPTDEELKTRIATSLALCNSMIENSS